MVQTIGAGQLGTASAFKFTTNPFPLVIGLGFCLTKGQPPFRIRFDLPVFNSRMMFEIVEYARSL